MTIKLDNNGLQELMYLLDDIVYSPGRSEVHYGCDCGCGGDDTVWYDKAEEAAEEAIKQLLSKYNIEVVV